LPWLPRGIIREPLIEKYSAIVSKEGDMESSINENELAEMQQKSDLKGLSEMFHNANNWDTREWAVVVLGNICREKRAGIDYARFEMIKILNDIVAACQAESTGGTYRTSCLENAQILLNNLDASPKDSTLVENENTRQKNLELELKEVLDKLRAMTAVNVDSWIAQNISSNPMLNRNSCDSYSLEEAADFVMRLQKGKVKHFDGGYEHVEFTHEVGFLEIYGQSGLWQRYIILKDIETEKYECCFAWLR
jgi:hypothetical protein